MTQDSIIKNVKVSRIQLPLIQAFRVASGDHHLLDNIMLELELADGTKGFGEAAIAAHLTGESVPATLTNLKSIAQTLKGKDAADYLQISSFLHEVLPQNKSAVAAVEIALMDALTRQWNMPLWRFFGNTVKPFTTDITIVIADLEETQNATQRFLKAGFKTFKIKVGRDFDLDIKRVLTIKKTSA